MSGTTETTPFGAGHASGGLTTPTVKESKMAGTQSIHIPTSRTHSRAECGNRSPHLRRCNRPQGHTGRHHFARRHLDGKVREVWA